MAKILFIVPSTLGRYGRPSTPHIGISYLAANVRQGGHIPQVLDLRVYGDNYVKIKEKVDSFKPDFLGITSVSLDYQKTYDMINVFSAWNIPIIYGGPHPSTVREKIYEGCTPYAVVYGEGEATLLEILNRKPLEEIEGLIFRNKSGEIMVNPPRAGIEPLDIIPFPDYGLSQMGLYSEHKIPLITSRECPYSCSYCSVDMVMGKGFRKRSPENVLEEIEHWYERGYKNFAIGDDNFSFDMKRAAKICDLIVERKLDISWELRTGIRVDRVDESLLIKMRDAGCRFIAYGIESIDNDILKNVKKGATFEQIERAVKFTERVGIPFSGFFIIGLPGDNFVKFKKLYEFACEKKFDEVRFYHFIPEPGTDIFPWVQKNGTFLVDPENILNEASSYETEPLFFTDDFTREERIRAHKMGEVLMVKLLLKKTLGKYFGAMFGLLCNVASLRKAMLNIGFKFTSMARKLQEMQART